jgi:transposase
VARTALAGPQKGANEQGATIVWVDESGFYPLPLAVRTWAPQGETPILHAPLTHDHLSAISAITLDGRLFLQVREDSYDGPAVVGFLRILLRKITGKLLVIWDGSPIHRNQAIKEFLSAGAASRLQLEQLPGYAPELNADEGIWNYVKRVELANVCCADLSDLRHHLLRAGARLRHKPEVVRACSRQFSPLVQVPDGLHLVFLPPYSPELQPAEHLWQYTDDPLVNQHFPTLAALEDALATRCDALQRQPAVLQSATLFHWWAAT